MSAIDRSHIAGAGAAHARLLETVGALDDATVHRPSLLPGWTVGHVLSHIARNAESHCLMLDALRAGRPAVQYPGGAEQRAADIEAGSDRSAAALVTDVRETTEAVDEAFASLPDALWDEPVSTGAGPAKAWDLPFRRWRETEVHHADLGLAFTFEDWSSGYVREDLRRREMSWRASSGPFGAGLPEAALRLPPNRRLAWLLGRLDVPGLPHSDF
jgi:maleylpyruvate isomerase